MSAPAGSRGPGERPRARSLGSLWTHWKRFAHRAAEVQGQVLFFLLYFLAIVPMGLVGLGGDGGPKRRAGEAPRWRPHDRRTADLDTARHQF